MLFVVSQCFYFLCLRVFSRHTLGFRICFCHVERKRNIFIGFCAISTSRHTWKPKLHFLHSQSLTIHTPHFRRFLYFTYLLIVIYYERELIKRLFAVFWQKHYEKKQTAREFNKIARKCKLDCKFNGRFKCNSYQKSKN